MIGIDTGRVAAQMVQFGTDRNRPANTLIHHPMRADSTPVGGDSPVSVMVTASLPYPAPAGRIDYERLMGQSIAMTEQVSEWFASDVTKTRVRVLRDVGLLPAPALAIAVTDGDRLRGHRKLLTSDDRPGPSQAVPGFLASTSQILSDRRASAP